MSKLYVRSGKPQTAKDFNAQLIAVEVFFLTPSVCYTKILQHATTLSGATIKKRQKQGKPKLYHNRKWLNYRAKFQRKYNSVYALYPYIVNMWSLFNKASHVMLEQFLLLAC